MRLRSIPIHAVSLILLVAACSSGADPAADGSYISEGDRAPEFTLPAADGGQIALSDFEGRKPVLLFFSMGPG